MEPIVERRMSPMRDDAYLAIRQAILSGQFMPGQRLRERELATVLGLSRTPVREAMRKLDLEGLVDKGEKGGLFVHEMSSEEAEELYAIRGRLEGLAARWTTLAMTAEAREQLQAQYDRMQETLALSQAHLYDVAHFDFHTLIYRLTGRRLIEEHLRRFLEYHLRLVRVQVVTADRLEIAQAEHGLLLGAILQGDADLADRLAIEHVQKSYEAYHQRIQGSE